MNGFSCGLTLLFLGWSGFCFLLGMMVRDRMQPPPGPPKENGDGERVSRAAVILS